MELKQSTRKGKRYMIDYKGKTIHFGSAIGETFIDHKDKNKKSAWEARHRKGQPSAWNDKNSPLFWARLLLWNKPTLRGSIEDVNKRYGFNIK